MKTLIINLILILFYTISIQGQNYLERELTNRYSESELVTISPTLTFDQAIQMLSTVSEISSGKKIVSTVSINSPVGIELNSVSYHVALNIIVNLMNLIYEEDEYNIVVKRKIEEEEDVFDESIFADITDKEVRISAIFFEADIENSKEAGMDWKWLIGKSGVNIGAELRSQSQIDENSSGGVQQRVLPPEFNVASDIAFTMGEFKGNALGMFKFFETKNLGEIIASPSISVRNKQPGKIQVGSDFSIKQRDFSGNTIDRFYSAGSIIEVTPYVYKKNDIEYILLKLAVEKSSFFPTDLTTVIKKTAANSDVLLLSGQETVIGGLYENEENVVRNGIPFLKDLPWWVFGIRYLTGYEEIVVRKKENIILIKAEILNTIEERVLLIEQENILRDQIEKDKKSLESYRQDYIDKEK